MRNASATKGTEKIEEHVLAFWTPEVPNQPARVTLMNFPSRTVLRQKNLFGVTEVRALFAASNFQPKLICIRFI